MSKQALMYSQRHPHQWWGVWPLDLRRLLHLVPRGVEFSSLSPDGTGLIGRRALCGKKLVAQQGDFQRTRDVPQWRRCSRCVRAMRAEVAERKRLRRGRI